MTPFMKIEDFLLPAPLPAIMAILMILGFKYLGNRLAKRLFQRQPDSIESAAGFILVTGLLASLSHMLAMFGLAFIGPFRAMAWMIAVFGIIELSQINKDKIHKTIKYVQCLLQGKTVWEKTGLLLIGITGFALFLASLGPPTDADSLDYHLGVPLDILRHHAAYPRPDWLHARLLGLGEYLNMFGLAGGTDILGAALQYSGLVAALIAIFSFVKEDSDRILVAMLVVGCPVMLFLIPSQKPQMFPTACTTVALIMIVHRFRSIDPVTISMTFGITCFAMSCKYSFILSGCIVIGIGMIAAYRSGRFGTAVFVGLAGFAIFLFPSFLQRYLFYGDPVTPMLERFLSNGNESIINFAVYLKNYKDSSVLFPLSLIVPDSLQVIVTTLGLGVLLVFLSPAAFKMKMSGALSAGDFDGRKKSLSSPLPCDDFRYPSRILAGCALFSGVLTFLLGQITSRFYLEPYLWMVTAIAAANAWKAKSIFFKAMLVQMAGVSAIAIFCAVILFPGALSPALRHHVMSKYAFHYGASGWLDTLLPANARILTDLRSKSLMPRPFISSEIVNYAGAGNENRLKKLSSIIKQNGVTVWVSESPLQDTQYPGFSLILLAEPKAFRLAIKNPWNNATSRVFVYGIEFLDNAH